MSQPSRFLGPACCVLAVVLGGSGCRKARAVPTASTSNVAPEDAPPVTPRPIPASVAEKGGAAPPAVPLPEAARTIERSCTQICERTRPLRCSHGEDCMPNCLAMAVGTPCADEFATLYRCLVAEPLEHWECAEDGVAALRDGRCESQQESAVGCMEVKAR